MTIHRGGNGGQRNYLDVHAMVASNDYTVTYPGGQNYTMDVGMVSGDTLRIELPCTDICSSP